MHELDQDAYFSPLHPKGDALKELLELGQKYKVVRKQRADANTEAQSSVPSVRSQFGVAFKWVTEKNLRKKKGAKQLEADAVTELKAGRPQLLEFCKKHRMSLEDQLDYIWTLHDAEHDIERLDKSLLDLLAEAAHLECCTLDEVECTNQGHQCAKIYNGILEFHGHSRHQFCYDLYETLKYGRRKGNAFMVVGGKDTGKTTVTQPLEHIYHTMKTPQSDSFCPLETIRGHDILLWQDFRYNPGHPKKEEVKLRLDIGTWNRLLEGLPTPIGVPKSDGSKTDFVYTENAPLIATGPFVPTGYKDGVPNEFETEQITCRIKFWHFRRPQTDDASLNRGFKPCPLCWSRWLLGCAAEHWQVYGSEQDHLLQKVMHIKSGALQGCASAPEVPCPGEVNALEEDAACDEEALQVLQDLERAEASTTAASSNAPPPSAPDLFQQLASLVEWRSKGLLSEQEFAQAKKKLLLE